MTKLSSQDELIFGMQRELQGFEKKEAMNNLVKAADYLQSAMDIFEQAGLTVQADKILKILSKIAEDNQDARGKPRKPKNPETISDRHTKGLTPERMVENLKHNGIVFNMADDGADILDADIDPDIEVKDEPISSETDFEDED